MTQDAAPDDATIAAFAPAKVNLTLHVTGRRGDGYHLLDSLVVFAGLGDRLTVRPAADWSLSVSGPFADGVPVDERNLVMRVARVMGGAPAAITLEKRLPHAAGLGGGSADAAATVRALQALDGRPIPADLSRLGADVPVCVRGRPARMSGIGADLRDVPDLPEAHLCLVNPRQSVATPAVFAALDRRENPPMPDPPPWRDLADLAGWLSDQRNDLEPPARAIAPRIDDALSRIAATAGCRLARMSGSGATCFGLYATAPAAAEASRAIRAAEPEWWVTDAPLLTGPAAP